MRILVAIGLVIVLGVVGVAVWTQVVRPPAAATRLAGVSVVVAGDTVDDLGDGRHRLNLTATVTSAVDVEDCLGFALDEPFAGRRLRSVGGECPRPRAGRQDVRLTFDGLTDDDVRFPGHTLVWGIPGGRCGPILTAFGVCVVDQAGTIAFELPTDHVLPSIPSFGSFGPIVPIYSLPPR